MSFFLSIKKPPSDPYKHRIKSFIIAFSIADLGTADFFPKYGIPAYPFGCLYQLVDITPSFAASQIIETMSDPAIVCDAEERIRVVNHAACSIFGYRERELLAMPGKWERFHEALLGGRGPE